MKVSDSPPPTCRERTNQSRGREGKVNDVGLGRNIGCLSLLFPSSLSWQHITFRVTPKVLTVAYKAPQELTLLSLWFYDAFPNLVHSASVICARQEEEGFLGVKVTSSCADLMNRPRTVFLYRLSLGWPALGRAQNAQTAQNTQTA